MAQAQPPAFKRSAKLMAALGVFAAAILAVNANVLVSRFYHRWDVTSDSQFTLSQATRVTLAGLAEPVEVAVLLARGDPLLPRVRQMLAAYGAETTRLRIRFVDPEQSPAEFQAIQKKYQISAGKTEEGRVVTDAVIVIAAGERSWFVTADDVTAFDDEGRARPVLEQALTEGLANVQRKERSRLCFGEGHRELSRGDHGPEGMSELERTLEKNNFELHSVNSEQPNAEQELSACRAILIAAPEVPYSQAAAERVASFVRGGGGLFLLAAPLFADSGRLQPSGLEPLARLAGVELEGTLVLESDPSARLPRGAGEVFLATPKPHAATRGLVQDDKVDFRVLVSEAQSLALVGGGPAKELLVSSEQALAVSDLSTLLAGKVVPDGAKQGRRVVAAAAELEKPAGSPHAHGPRLIVVGAGNLTWNRSFQDAALLGDQLFVENALGWVASRPALVSVPEKAAHEVGLALTEEAMSEVLRYVLIYMPGVAVLLGVLVMLERRKGEKRGRASAEARRKADQEPTPDEEAK